jgi:hypothetical protein
VTDSLLTFVQEEKRVGTSSQFDTDSDSFSLFDTKAAHIRVTNQCVRNRTKFEQVNDLFGICELLFAGAISSLSQ